MAASAVGQRRAGVARRVMPLLVVFIVALPAATGLWAIRYARPAAAAQAIAGERAAAESAASQLSRGVITTVVQARAMAARPDLADAMSAGNRAGVPEILRSIYVGQPFRTVAVADADGSILTEFPHPL